MFVRIPTERVAVLIGPQGRTKKMIEKKSKTSIEVEQNTVEVSGEAIDELNASEVVKAIGRGFSPEKALKLLDESYQLSIIPLGETEKARKRILGRIIGKSGKSREHIEQYADCDISVFGKTVSVIAPFSKARIAVDAIEMLIEGKTHNYVFSVLEKRLGRLHENSDI